MKCYKKKVLTCVMGCAILFGCGVQTPNIDVLEASRLIIQQADGILACRLSVFVRTSAEGADSFSSLTITDLNTGMGWVIYPQTAEIFEEESKRHNIGSNHLAHPYGAFPAGEYIVEFSTFSGKKNIKNFFLPQFEMPTRMPISLSIDNTMWHITVSDDIYKNTPVELILLGVDKKTIARISVDLSQEGSIAELQEQYAATRYIQAALNNESSKQIFFTHPIAIDR